MTYAILKNGKPLADVCTKRPIIFESREMAEKFATNHLLNIRSDAHWRRPGHRKPEPKLTVVEAAA